jgi:hypothetical protein
VLRFGTATTHRRKLTTSHQRWRLWKLFVAACVVLWCMRMLDRPDIAERVDAVFTPEVEESATHTPEDEVELVPIDSLPEDTPAVSFQRNELVTNKTELPAEARFDLSAVKDNTYFRSEENAAWFAVWNYLQGIAANELKTESLGEITYAQFIDQPEIYRGQVVTIRGTVMREELLAAPENNAVIKNYHRLIVRPAGGGVWPMVVYSLQLPPKFPTGEKSRTDIEVSGVFFKNWSYSWQDGLGLAPVILANSFDWQPPPVLVRPRTQITLQGVLAVVAVAGVLATIVGWLAWRQTRRPIATMGDQYVVISPPEAQR